MIATRRGNKAAVEEAYLEYQSMLEGIATNLARQYKLEYEEVKAEANLVFLEAYHSHNPAMGDLRTRIGFLVSRRLRDGVRRAAMRQKNLPRIDLPQDEYQYTTSSDGSSTQKRKSARLTLVSAATTVDRPAFDRNDVIGPACPDAQFVIGALLDDAGELQQRLVLLTNPGRQLMRRTIFNWLQEQGWTDTRIWNAFRAIRDVLP